MTDRIITEFEIESQEGNERQAIDLVEEAVASIGLPEERIERLKTAVGEATMNAIEHGNKNDPALPVTVSVALDPSALRIRISDRGSGRPEGAGVATPDIEAKLAGDQSPRGWGLFLIESMVDEVSENTVDGLHTVELVMYLEGGRE
jgi:anti-sigma regulatory factor (Ser/Thr protein kinase)